MTFGLCAPAEAQTCTSTTTRFVFAGIGDDTGHNGQCWAEAYATLDKALADLNAENSAVTTILIAQGTYTPSGTNGSFVIERACTIEGGYRGFTDGGGSANDRNLALYRTILSGDLGEGQHASRIMMVLTAFEATEEFGDLVLDGLEFTGGLQESGSDGGAALWAVGEPISKEREFEFHGRISVLHCVFNDNHARADGGAIFAQNWDLRVRNSLFEGNSVSPAGFGVTHGGAICVRQCALTISNCRFEGNSATGGGGNLGGAIAVIKTADAVIGNGTFVGNAAAGAEGGFGTGGRGGAVHFGTDSEGPTFMNCVFHDNDAGAKGGAIFTDHPIEIHSSTFHGNNAGKTGGAFHGAAEVPAILVNSILWGNTCQDEQALPIEEQIAPLNGSASADFEISHSCIQDLDTQTFDDGNLNDDPRFVNASGGDLRLSHCSEMIDSGAATLLPADLADVNDDLSTTEDLPVDVELEARVLGSEVDMGAFEFVEPTCPGDFNGDGIVNGNDMGTLLGYWGTGGAFSIADFNCDEIVDGDDLGELLGYWGECDQFMMSGGGSGEGGGISPQDAAEAFGFEIVEEFVEWLSGLDFQTMSALLEGLFGG